mmetsp:Transcript_22782/g.62970  ORF Transcript_22782/g.62970 Transcript_22782/m.62970 type:complete len:397 (+) Transcript_22782:114-1304(+)|eukprot:CAMPEP_0202390434 /NCGR_PEP_ID=MMETSP1127-20130417/88593_1 /ASSEMBLY_ACC=CAM_ASM_000462 /TAXON_ID=3047 /ORGANISM="Dunaliella tertiolecta, Strain CCMP1320" /LENGTH=396 /DNA_ID=CAMNT_0048992623 /DNA_START=63 /DNA_END=1253 /DNA_ORIENTATION=-
MHVPDDGLIQFAKRRPDWELRSMHQGLLLTNAASCLDTRTAGTRMPCPRCKKSRALYCYDCVIPLLDPAPRVQLPFQLSILTHSSELSSKNTGVHAAILAPDQARLHSLDACPPFDASRAVVLYPSNDALEVGQLEPNSIDRVFIIDSKWKESKEMMKHPLLSGVRRVKLKDARSAFWRFHTAGVGEEGLCTIECLYFFLKALAEQGKMFAPASSATASMPSHSQAAPSSLPSSSHGAASLAPTATPSAAAPALESAAPPSLTPAAPPSAAASAKETSPALSAAATSHASAPAAKEDPGASSLYHYDCQGGGANSEGAAEGAATYTEDQSKPGSSHDPHAFDDLLWYFSCQHNYVSKIAAQRLEKHKAKKAQSQSPTPEIQGQSLSGNNSSKRRKK